MPPDKSGRQWGHIRKTDHRLATVRPVVSRGTEVILHDIVPILFDGTPRTIIEEVQRVRIKYNLLPWGTAALAGEGPPRSVSVPSGFLRAPPERALRRPMDYTVSALLSHDEPVVGAASKSSRGLGVHTESHNRPSRTRASSANTTSPPSQVAIAQHCISSVPRSVPSRRVKLTRRHARLGRSAHLTR